jgi:hypothetical protein
MIGAPITFSLLELIQLRMSFVVIKQFIRILEHFK